MGDDDVRALAALMVGAPLVLGGALGAVLFLVRQNCGSDFGYYGCATPPDHKHRCN